MKIRIKESGSAVGGLVITRDLLEISVLSLLNATSSWLTFGLNISEQVSEFGLHKIHDETFGDAVIFEEDRWHRYSPHDDPVHVSMCG